MDAHYKNEIVNNVVNEERLRMSRKSATLEEHEKRLANVCMGSL